MATRSEQEALDTSIDQLQSILRNAPKDSALRKKLYYAAQDMTSELEAPGDTAQRLVHIPLQLSIACIGGDLGLFTRLADNESPLKLDQLAKDMEVDDVLLKRLLQYLASLKMIKEVGVDTFTASNITHTLSRPAIMAGMRHGLNLVLPCYKQLPTFLAETKYQNPTNPLHCPFQPAHNTEGVPFNWALKHPEILEDANLWMTVHHEGSKIWLDEFPFEAEMCKGVSNPVAPLFVDIGGGIGHQCQLLQDRCPSLPGRLILQDQAPAIAQALPLNGVEKMVYNFFSPQPVKGAKAYYLRNVLHDYPDAKCIEILHQITAAMTEGSVVLIDEVVLPAEGAHWRVTQLDLCMMSCLAATERSEQQWLTLLSAAGMKIVKIWTYSEELRESVIVAVPKD